MSNYYLTHTGAEIDAGIDKANEALPKTGGTMSGALILNDDPALNLGAATKQYVDKASVAKAYTENAVETALGDAKQYTDSEVESALTEAKNYTDGKIPTAVKNPQPLTFEGGVSCTYDGSSPVTAHIPSTVGLASESYVDEKVSEIQIPTRLANPQALIFTGAATGTYDGSNELVINIPQGGGSGGGVTSWNDLEDRPFGVETRTAIIEETIIIPDIDTATALYETPLNGTPTTGAKYTVKWANETYECIGRDVSAATGTTTILVGNFDVLSGVGDSGEPFVILMYPEGYEGNYAQIMCLNPSHLGAHIVLKIESVEVSKIPEELMPTMPGIVFVDVVGVVSNRISGWTTDASFMDAFEALTTGSMVFLRVTDPDDPNVMVIIPCGGVDGNAGMIRFVYPAGTTNNYIYGWSADGSFTEIIVN